MTTLNIQNLGQIKEASLSFGDLTVLVGPQATGKSIALQLLKLMLDAGQVQEEMGKYGLDWEHRLPEFLDVYLGEGMRAVWQEGSTSIEWEGKPVDLPQMAKRKRPNKEETLFFIPAQRVLALRDGWPRPFTDYTPGDPFAVREFSEKLRVLVEQEFGASGDLFPQERRLKREFRDLLQRHVFSNFHLKVDKFRSQKRLVLGPEETKESLPYMVWSAGQREFVPLLLGFYWLMPPTKVARREALEWVVVEELEMGLHPQAVSVALLLVLELLSRNYKVCLSTHSPQVLELVWALNRIRQNGGSARDILDVFDLPQEMRRQLHSVAELVLHKKLCVYYFDRSEGRVHNISNLDPASPSVPEGGWGGLSEFSQHANEVVARVIAN